MANGYARYSGLGGGSGGGVTSLNTLTGAVILAAGPNIALSTLGNTITISGDPGTVTSVGLADASTIPLYAISGSPVTSSGTLTFTLQTQLANTVLAGPTTGSAAQPTFRTLVAADIPSLTGTYANVTLSNLTSPTAINQNLLPGTTNTFNIGSSSDYWVDIFSNRFTVIASGSLVFADPFNNPYGTLTTLSGITIPDGTSNLGFSIQNQETGSIATSNAIGIFTANDGLGGANQTGNIYIQTGNKTSGGNTGPSGNINIRVGTSSNTGTRGLIQLQNGSEGTSGQIWTSTDTVGSGHWAANSGALAITALTGDVTATGPGSAAATLATVNTNVGSFGSSTSIPSFTVNGKGLITAASGNVVIAPAGTLSGTTLNSTVVTSSLTSVGTISTGVWQGTPIGASYVSTLNQNTTGTAANITATSNSTLTTLSSLSLPTSQLSGDVSLTTQVSGILPVANGGTSLGTLTANNVILGNGTSAPNFVAPGTIGNALVSNGTTWTSAPVTATPTINYASAYHINGAVWFATSLIFGPMTYSSGTVTLLPRISNGITLTAAASNAPGIVFTPAAITSIYQITALFTDLGDSNFHSYELTDGTNVIATRSMATSSPFLAPVNLSGLYAPGTTSPVTIQIYAGVNSGTAVIENGLDILSASIEWSIIQIA